MSFNEQILLLVFKRRIIVMSGCVTLKMVFAIQWSHGYIRDMVCFDGRNLVEWETGNAEDTRIKREWCQTY